MTAPARIPDPPRSVQGPARIPINTSPPKDGMHPTPGPHASNDPTRELAAGRGPKWTWSNIELELHLALAHRLPNAWGVGVINNLQRRIYTRKPRAPVQATVPLAGVPTRMLLDPHQIAERVMLFQPRQWERKEVASMRAALRQGDTFVDVGANVGGYTLTASRIVGPTGRVVSIEPLPEMADRLQHHLDLNHVTNVTLNRVGVGALATTERMRTGGQNVGGSTFLSSVHAGRTGPDVPTTWTRPLPIRQLADVLHDDNVSRVRMMKMDIEGYEYRALKPFLREEHAAMWPTWLLIEMGQEFEAHQGGDIDALLTRAGYERQKWRSQENGLYKLTRSTRR